MNVVFEKLKDKLGAYYLFRSFGGLLIVALLLSCGNRMRSSDAVIDDDQPTIEQIETDTATSSVPEETPKVEEKPSAPSSSSSPLSHKSSSYDNMRGFDPASEDDMDDNGMSRYMENDDDEGWD